MMTVMSPRGIRVQFNQATYALRGTSYTDIYERQGGAWIAQVPTDWLIEVLAPCRVYHAGESADDLEVVARRLESRPQTSSQEDKQLRRIKRALARWDARGGYFR